MNNKGSIKTKIMSMKNNLKYTALVFFLAFTFLKVNAQNSNWSADYAGGVDQAVWELTIDGDNVYVGGSFMKVDISGANTDAGRLGIWDKNTNTWDDFSTLTLGNSYYIDEVVIDGTDKYIGGFLLFSPTTGVAKWNTGAGSFLQLGEGLKGNGFGGSTVEAMALNGTNLYVGGLFHTVKQTSGAHLPVGRIAQWDGTTWSGMGAGLSLSGTSPGRVYDITVKNSTNTYVGGSFDLAGTTTTNNIAVWNGTGWTALGVEGLNDAVKAIAIASNGDVYVGGDFTATVGGTTISVNHIVKWNGSTWVDLGGGVDGNVESIVIGPDGNVYVGGSFTTAGGNPASNIAKWDVTSLSWSSIGSGTDGPVYALAADAYGVFVGGQFTMAGSKSNNNIAHINLACPSVTILASKYCIGESTTFSLSVLGDISGATSVDWDFGDGTTVLDNPTPPAHTYSDIGAYTVTVTITGVIGLDSEECVIVEQREITIADCIQCEECISSFAPIPDEKYVLSAWVKEDGPLGKITYNDPAIELYFAPSTTLTPFKASGQIIDGWQRIEQEFTVPVGSTSITVRLLNGGTGEVYFDDIRIYPFNSSMKSFVYDPITLRLAAELDENNYATFYEYDEEGGLIRVEKETEDGKVTIQASGSNTQKPAP